MKRDLFENIVRLWVDRFVILEGDDTTRYVDSQEVQNTRNEIYDYIIKHSNDADVQAIADELGINFSDNDENFKNRDEFLKIKKTKLPNNRAIMTNVPQEITDAVKDAVVILKQCTGQSSGTFNKEKLMALCGQNVKEYNRMLKMKDFIDRISLTYLYDSSKMKKNDVNQKQKRFGVVFKKDGTYDDSKFDLDNITDSHAKNWLKGGKRKEKFDIDEAKVEVAKDIVEKYCENVYGIKFTTPNFSIGNDKVKNALIINFASAFRCPAWNFCLVKHACYARSGEVAHYNIKQSNDKKNLMWLKAGQDDELFALIHKLLRCCAIDYEKVAKKTNLNIDYLINNTFETLNKDNPEILEVIKKYKRVPYIRLNENGDFLSGDFLLKFDKTIAADFKLVDIPSAAYTCMIFGNAEETEKIINKIDNIILNASKDELKGKAIARYFYAIPEDLFNKFDETYGSGLNTSFVINKDKTIGHNPQPLYDYKTNQPNGNYYYKCPCGRTDYKTINEGTSKINCYQCNLCYQPKVESITGKYYVFVIAHGSEKEALKTNEEYVIKNIGICNSMRKKENNNIKPQNDYQIGSSQSMAAKGASSDAEKGLQESIDGNKLITQNMRREAFRTIGINAVGSMNDKINEITRLNEMKEDFFDKLKKLD